VCKKIKNTGLIGIIRHLRLTCLAIACTYIT
jgi:hypothetical protein